MKPADRVVTRLPLEELWDERGVMSADFRRDLDSGQLRDLLRKGSVRLVVADVGLKLEWITSKNAFKFWKAEVSPRLADPRKQQFQIDQFPGGYCYLASEWSDGEGEPIVVLRRVH
jgi:hypothetical protein